MRSSPGGSESAAPSSAAAAAAGPAVEAMLAASRGAPRHGPSFRRPDARGGCVCNTARVEQPHRRGWPGERALRPTGMVRSSSLMLALLVWASSILSCQLYSRSRSLKATIAAVRTPIYRRACTGRSGITCPR
eukprot:scaffold1882_cov384-Prasinococcus_capsulatus_cf.AAC.9